jgi:hypothetical protein
MSDGLSNSSQLAQQYGGPNRSRNPGVQCSTFETEAEAQAYAAAFLRPGGARPLPGYRRVEIIYPYRGTGYLVEVEPCHGKPGLYHGADEKCSECR